MNELHRSRTWLQRWAWLTLGFTVIMTVGLGGAVTSAEVGMALILSTTSVPSTTLPKTA